MKICDIAVTIRAMAGLALVPLLIIGTPPASAAEQQVNIYNWADYIGKNTIAEFERQTGIKVVYDTYDWMRRWKPR